ncbi:MAG: hypothetical protein H8E28_07080 [Anaerolineae bacterium]|nr:hypothetical protein [Anaerolineae bacterium]
MHKKILFVILALILGLALASCASAPEAPESPAEPAAADCPEADCPECPEPEACPEPLVSDVPFAEEWAGSPHADSAAEAFRHWDEDDPAVVATACAKCHSSEGYVEFLETGANVFELPAAENMGIQCVACHNTATGDKTSVVMPSGVELLGLGDEARCMECHQGRASTVSVNAKFEELGLVEDVDTVSEDLGFINIHYFAAAATKYGTLAMGGYQYDGKTYDGNFAHVGEFDTCIECHDPHTLEVKVDDCQVCHTDVAAVEDFANVRMKGSLVDFDGDGDMEEGIKGEIEGMQAALYSAVQAYAADVAGVPLVYDSHTYPYFFIDTDANGEVTEGEANYGNKYNAWTARLVKAAYNYQVSLKDTGGFAHGGKYIIELLYDSIEDLNPEAVAGLHRIDHGHFAGSEEAFRHWDEDGTVSSSCARCHSADGLPLFLTEGVNITTTPSNGFECTTCHNDLAEYTIYGVSEVTFPSGAKVALEDTSGLCMSCHQGRASTNTVNAKIAGAAPDTVVEGLGFTNVHYFAAGATRFGTDAKGGYEYDGKEYVGFFEHADTFQSCTDCHGAHTLEVKTDECGVCHAGVETQADLAGIRNPEVEVAVDYDGDGDIEEGVAGEIETMAEALYVAIQAYAEGNADTAPIVYDSHAYPYFFTDTGDRYATWTPKLTQAAYNYQYALKDPGGFAHNASYIMQLLYDSIQSIGGDVAGMTRP